MLIETHISVALLCPDCGRLSWHVLSLFSLGDRCTFHCDCGTEILTVEKKPDGYWFKTECVFCQSEHSQPFTRKSLVAPCAHVLYCSEGDYVTGCIGPEKEVKKYFSKHRRSLTQVALEVSSPDYFQNSKVMFGILERLYEMAETGELYCNCGNHNLEIEIFPDKVKIHCEQCGLGTLIPATLAEDLENFLLMGIIPMKSKELIQQGRQKLQKHRNRTSHMD